VLAPTPRWRWPLALLAVLAVLALGVLAAAFIGLSSDDPPPAVTRTQIVTTQPAAVPATAGATGATGGTAAP
jgi:peptidoglycan/LPS O-acetylase OafA/YrhL